MVDNATRARTKAGRESAPPVEIVLGWIAAAWAAVPTELIIDSFRACGITANTDLTDIVSSMTCFKDGGQLAAHKAPFLAALNATSDSDNDEIENTIDD